MRTKGTVYFFLISGQGNLIYDDKSGPLQHDKHDVPLKKALLLTYIVAF